MPAQPLPEQYRTAGGEAPAGRELLRSYTCIACGSRHASWATFRTHRIACSRRAPATPDTQGAGVAQAPHDVVHPTREPLSDDVGPEGVGPVS